MNWPPAQIWVSIKRTRRSNLFDKLWLLNILKNWNNLTQSTAYAWVKKKIQSAKVVIDFLPISWCSVNTKAEPHNLVEVAGTRIGALGDRWKVWSYLHFGSQEQHNFAFFTLRCFLMTKIVFKLYLISFNKCLIVILPRYQFIIPVPKTLRGIFLIQFYLFAMESCLIMSIISTYMHLLQKKTKNKHEFNSLLGLTVPDPVRQDFTSQKSPLIPMYFLPSTSHMVLTSLHLCLCSLY